MKKILYTLLVFACSAIVSCSKDYGSGSITLDNDGFFVENLDDSITTTFTYENLASVTVYSQPNGWETTISMGGGNGTVTAYAPDGVDDEDGEEDELLGTIALYCLTLGGSEFYKTIQAGVVEFVELDDVQANSMVVNKAATIYTFNPKRRGESLVEDINPADCHLEWGTSNYPIKYVRMLDDGRVSFFTNFDTNDIDDDGDESDLINGNALIAALSANDDIIWTWHIWVTEEDISTVDIGGVSFMDRNLGAFMNCNEYISDDIDETDAIYASYGLYYQWGRRDPFLYPSSYNAMGNFCAPTYNKSGQYLNFVAYASSSLTGNLSYTTLHPRYFICGNEKSNYDWLYSGSDSSLWGENGAKSIYDPSPKGWRVPSSADLAKIGDPDVGVEASESDYGAYLGGELFMGLGRRVYRDGSVQNYAPGELYKPWSGYYWSRDSAADGANGEMMASSLHFYIDEGTTTVSIDRAESNYRSTGMQIRCVKDE